MWAYPIAEVVHHGLGHPRLLEQRGAPLLVGANGVLAQNHLPGRPAEPHWSTQGERRAGQPH